MQEVFRKLNDLMIIYAHFCNFRPTFVNFFVEVVLRALEQVDFLSILDNASSAYLGTTLDP